MDEWIWFCPPLFFLNLGTGVELGGGGVGWKRVGERGGMIPKKTFESKQRKSQLMLYMCCRQPTLADDHCRKRKENIIYGMEISVEKTKLMTPVAST